MADGETTTKHHGSAHRNLQQRQNRSQRKETPDMFCSSCGSVVKPNVKYCNHCGDELVLRKSPGPNPDYLVAAITLVTIVGLGAVPLAMVVMNGLHLNEGLIIFFSLLVFLTFLGVDGFFISQLLRARRSGAGIDAKLGKQGNTTSDLDVAGAHLLPEPRSSVTDHTTRTLDPVNRVEGT
jgi:hypothetical protein